MQTRSDELKQNLKYQFPLLLLLLLLLHTRAGAAVSVVRDGGQELAIRPTSPITIRHRQLSLDPLFPCQAWSGCWVI